MAHEAKDGQVKNGKKIATQKVYRYIVVGMIVTDEPIEKFEGKNELFMDGPVNGLAEPLATVKRRNPSHVIGDACSVLCGLNDL